MERERMLFCQKLYNELLKRTGIEADKYEREDAFMSAIMDIENGVDIEQAFITSFDVVHDYELTDMIYNSVYSLVKGFK